jgi:isoleucyl-tRNA synthetase
VIWTTTPWTIPQNRAICFGPGIDYGLYEVTGRPRNAGRGSVTYIIAKNLAEDAFAAMRLTPSMYRFLRDVTADELEKLTCAHPLRGAAGADGEWDFDVRLLEGLHVTDDAGTGFVHTAPSHGDDDYEIVAQARPRDDPQYPRRQSFRADLPFFRRRADHPRQRQTRRTPTRP